MYISKTFTKAKRSALCTEYPSNELNPIYPHGKLIFDNLLINSSKIYEVEYLIHYLNFNM